MWREGMLRPVPVPRHNREVSPKFVAVIIAEAGLTREEFLRCL
jgi:hypothetical protein